MRGVFITATDTGAGKTSLARLLIPALENKGITVCVRKPVESGCGMVDGEPVPADAMTLAKSLRRRVSVTDICPYALRAVASPARAAQLENKTITLDMLVSACAGDNNAFLLVEGAGGICSPISGDALNIDLACALGLPLILVVKDKLGCISQTLAALKVAAIRQRPVAAVILMSFECPSSTNVPESTNSDTDHIAELRQWVDTDLSVLRITPDAGENDATITRLVTLIKTCPGNT